MKIKEESFWLQELNKSSFPQLDKDISTDILIIGGGLTGILSAYLLSKTNKKVVLIECGKIFKDGATAYTTAFITQVIDTDLHELIKTYGDETAQKVVDSGGDAIDLIERIISEEKISCDFMRCPAYFYASEPEQFEDLEKEKDAASQLGLKSVLRRKNDLSFKNFGYLKIENQAKFHPIKFAQSVLSAALKNGVTVYENTEALEVSDKEPFSVKTKGGNITTQQVILATYYPLGNPKEVLLKKGMYKSYIIQAFIPENSLEEAIYMDKDNPYHYFRVDKDFKMERDQTGWSLILGGEDHKSAFKIDEKKNFAALEEYLKEYFPDTSAKLVRAWDGPILEPSDGLALIGDIKPNYLLATAFSGNGMTYAAISAIMFGDYILGRQNIYAKIYDPKRIKTPWIAKKAIDYIEEFFGGATKNIFRKKSSQVG